MVVAAPLAGRLPHLAVPWSAAAQAVYAVFLKIRYQAARSSGRRRSQGGHRSAVILESYRQRRVSPPMAARTT